jgi:hypothetical protein
MWGSVFGLALLAALNPMRLGLVLLMISRPRPGPNLLAYWAGGLTVCVPELVIPLLVLHSTRMFAADHGQTRSPTPGSALAHIQIAIGAIGLTIAAAIALRALARHRAPTPVVGGGSADSTGAAPLPRLLDRAEDDSAIGRSAMRRLLVRARNAWEGGSLWVAWVIGLVSVPVDGVLFMVAIIVASGTALGTQLSAALAFVVVMYAAVEIILVGYVATPAKTQALLRLLHEWVRTYRRHILIVLFTVVGVSQLVQGLGSG